MDAHAERNEQGDSGSGTQRTAARGQVDIIGCNHQHIREYVSVRRPDVLGPVERILDAALGGDRSKDGIVALMALTYSAGRASVVAEMEGRTIAAVCKDGY